MFQFHIQHNNHLYFHLNNFLMDKLYILFVYSQHHNHIDKFYIELNLLHQYNYFLYISNNHFLHLGNTIQLDNQYNQICHHLVLFLLSKENMMLIFLLLKYDLWDILNNLFLHQVNKNQLNKVHIHYHQYLPQYQLHIMNIFHHQL